MNKMKNYLGIFAILLASFPLIGQDCPDNELYNQWDIASNATRISDQNTEFYGSMLFADDFYLAQRERVNTVCWLANTNVPPRLRDDLTNTRAEDCDPNVMINITYYDHDPVNYIPGNTTIATFLVQPNLDQVVSSNVCKFSATHDPVLFEDNTIYWISISANTSTFCDYQLVGTFPANAADLNRQRIAGRSNSLTPSARNVASTSWFPDDFCASVILSNQGLAPIPTLSQWGIIVLGIGIIIFGLVYVRNNQKKLA